MSVLSFLKKHLCANMQLSTSPVQFYHLTINMHDCNYNNHCKKNENSDVPKRCKIGQDFVYIS